MVIYACFYIYFFFVLPYIYTMTQTFFKLLASFSKAVLPSLTKRRVDLSKATKAQKLLFAYRLWVTKKSLD